MGFVFDPLLFSGFVPSSPSSASVPIYPNAGSFPAGAAQGSLAVAADTGIIYEWNGSAWVPVAGPGVMTSIGPIDSQTASTNGAVDANNQLVLQSATNVVPGLVNTTTQSFLGQKTFSTGLTGTLTGHATLDLPLTGGTMSGAINMGANQINNVANPTASQDAMTLNYANATYIPLTAEGVANGVATLDSSGKVPVTQLPSVVMEYQGAWNPNTNIPTLNDSTGTNGYVYYVSATRLTPVIGLTDPSMTNFQIGDITIYSASIGKWQLTTPAAGVQSVNGAQGVVTVNAINQLTGDVAAGPASGSQSASSTVNLVGGQTAASIATATTTVAAATSANTPSTLVERDASGNFVAGTITANLTGNASGSSSSFTGSLSGDVTGTQNATVVATVGGSTAASVNTVTSLINTAYSSAVFLASPNTGGSGLPAFRQIVANDLPNLSGLYANLALNNLGTTSINSSLVPANTSINIGSSAVPYAEVYTQNMMNPLASSTLTISTANQTGSNASGQISISSGATVNGNSGNILLSAALPSGTGTQGQVEISASALNMINNKIINVADPTSSGDAMTLNYFNVHASQIVSGDIAQTSFVIANNQSAAANVTGLAFANGSVESAEVQYSIVISATTPLYESGTIHLIQKGGVWSIAQSANFDNTNVIFSVTNAGQVQYTSPNYAGYTNGKMQFRAWVTGV